MLKREISLYKTSDTLKINVVGDTTIKYITWFTIYFKHFLIKSHLHFQIQTIIKFELGYRLNTVTQ